MVVVVCMCDGGYCRMSMMTTEIYVLNIAAYHSTQPLYPAALCCRLYLLGSSTLRLPARRRQVRRPRLRRHRRRRRRPRVGRGRPSAGWPTRGLPPYIIASTTPSVVRCDPPIGPDLVSTADRQFALSLVRTIPRCDAVIRRVAQNTEIPSATRDTQCC